MWCVRFPRSTGGRVLCVAAGLSLIVYGATHPSLLGLVLMMAGMVPAITGLAGIGLRGGVWPVARLRGGGHVRSDHG